MKRVGFVLRRHKAEAEAILSDLVPWLIERGCEVFVLPDREGVDPRVRVVPENELAARIDLLVVLGGDGTLLHGGGLVAGEGVPVLGINLGHLGFLVPFAPTEARDAIDRALSGRLQIEQRIRLRVRLHRAGQSEPVERYALNDAVVAQSAMARLIELVVTLDDIPVTTYRADGLIVCTPSGSTAYNLAAGGPILTPGQSSMVITPICPHTLTNRPLVVPATSRVQIELPQSRSVLLTVDGQWAYALEPGDRVEVSEAAAPLRVFRSEKSYFEILREKLAWGQRAS